MAPITQTQSTAAAAASLVSDGATKSRFELNFFAIGRIDKPDKGERCPSSQVTPAPGTWCVCLISQANFIQPWTELSYDFDFGFEGSNQRHCLLNQSSPATPAQKHYSRSVYTSQRKYNRHAIDTKLVG